MGATRARPADLLPRQAGLFVPGAFLLGALLLLATLVPAYRLPAMSVQQVVRVPSSSLPAADAAYSGAQASDGVADLVRAGGAGDVADVAGRTTHLSRTSDGSIQIDVRDSDAQRALREADAATSSLLARIPGSSKQFADTVGQGWLPRIPALAITLVTLLGIAAVSLAGVARGRLWAGVALGALALDCLATWLYPVAPHVAILALVALVAVAVWATLVRVAGWWRAGVAGSLALTVFRSGAFSGALPDAAWLAGQFGGLLVATVAELVAWRRDAQGSMDDHSEARSLRDRVADARFFAIPLVALWLWSATSAIWSLTPRATLAQAALFGVVAAFLLSAALLRWRDRDVLARDLLLAMWTAALGILLAWFPLIPHAANWTIEPRTGRFVGFTSNSNFAGAVAAVCAALALGLAWRLGRPWLYGLAALLVAPLVLTGSRGALLGFGCALVLFLAERRRWGWLLGCMLGAAAALGILVASGHVPSIFRRQVGGQDVGMDSGRDSIYGNALHLWLQRPLTGHGYRTTEHLVATGQTAHNIELAVLVELGAVGALLFAALLVAVLLLALRRRPTVFLPAVVAGLIVEQLNSSLFGFSGPAALLVWLAMAAVVADGASPVALDAAPLRPTSGSEAMTHDGSPTLQPRHVSIRNEVGEEDACDAGIRDFVANPDMPRPQHPREATHG